MKIRLRWYAAGVLALLVAFGHRAMAQSEGEGLFLLLPIGARAVSLGESVVATPGGSEQVWWNPAAIVRRDAAAAGTRGREVAIHHANTLVGNGNTISLVYPLQRVGAVAASVNLLDLGRQLVTDPGGGEQGTINPLYLAYVLSYAVAPTRFLSLGASVKRTEMRTSCSGFCADVPVGSAKASGVDLGALVSLSKLPLTIGLAARHLGIGEGDTKPGRIDLGANYRIQALDAYAKDLVEVYASASLLATTRLDSISPRVGLDVVVEQRVHVRGGYIVDRANGSGASIGFGVVAGRFVFDLGRSFGGLLATGDHQPTYFSLRYLW